MITYGYSSGHPPLNSITIHPRHGSVVGLSLWADVHIAGTGSGSDESSCAAGRKMLQPPDKQGICGL
jgi:hypothetical protein